MWMTFKKAEIAKTLRIGLSIIETKPLNHNWLDFAILSGLVLHQFKKKLLLSHIKLFFSKLKLVKPNKNRFSLLVLLIFTNPLEVQLLN